MPLPLSSNSRSDALQLREPPVEDVLLLILAFCEISSILAMSESSRYFHRLACQKSVWLAATTALARRGFVDERQGEPMLHELSKDQLVEIAKRAVRGPRTWRREYGGPPVVSSKIILRSGTANLDCPEFEVNLLPGGRYLFHLHGVLDCWSIHERKIIWTQKCMREGSTISAFVAQLVDTVDQAVIMTCQQNSVTLQNHVEITTLDFENETSETVVIALVRSGSSSADDFNDDGTYAHPQICGDFAAVSVRGDVILFNWRERINATVHFTDTPRFFMNFCRLALTPTHAIVLLPDERLELIALNSLPWTPVDEFNLPRAESVVSASALPSLHTEHLPAPAAYAYGYSNTPAYILMSAYPHPAQAGLFRVWLYINRNPGTGTQYCFHIRLPLNAQDKRPPTFWQRASAPIGPSQVQFCGSPFSGQLVHYKDATYHMVPPGEHHGDRDYRAFEMDDRQRPFLHISQYSGGLAYGTLDSLVVRYYE
ncbi:hypothetical protein C8R46DRAFT_1197113 [Mycena filopes]|nr:hypothetical protein C8R46DRAFT_1197113 [Mycena filopes]